MTNTVLTERRWTGGFLVSEANGERSRDQVTLLQQSAGVILDAGTVLGLIGPSTGHPTYTAAGGNTGNFTCGTITESAGAIVGTYNGELTNATHFNVYDPNGKYLGEGVMGSAFAGGGLSFTITAGGTPGVVGDTFTIAVAANANAGLYTPVNFSGTDGSQNAVAIMFDSPFDVTQANTKQTVISRAAEVNANELEWPSGATSSQIAAATVQLTALGIVVRAAM